MFWIGFDERVEQHPGTFDITYFSVGFDDYTVERR